MRPSLICERQGFPLFAGHRIPNFGDSIVGANAQFDRLRLRDGIGDEVDVAVIGEAVNPFDDRDRGVVRGTGDDVGLNANACKDLGERLAVDDAVAGAQATGDLSHTVVAIRDSRRGWASAWGAGRRW